MDQRHRRSASGPAGRATPGAPSRTPDAGEPTVYEIRVRGHLDARWAGPREGLSVRHEAGGDTILTVPVVDQAALHGLMRRLRDLGVPLVSINPAGLGPTRHSRREESR